VSSLPDTGAAPDLDVLIPTFGRPAALPLVLAGLAGQAGAPPFRVVVSSQDDTERWPAEVVAMAGILRARGVETELVRHLPRRGLAEHRDALLGAATAPMVLFLDDDIWLEPDAVARMVAVLLAEGCGFVGSAPIGWSYLDDVRPHEQAVEAWHGRVQPERLEPDGPGWERHRLHNAANMFHAARALGLHPGETVAYRVAWVGGCVLYDAGALRDAGGFGFWRDLPPEHVGEDVVAELRVMRARGGCGILPSGAWHLELPTTVPVRNVDAPRALPV
jgi:glycosyltransferase involved in cell wall biosynthesis